MSEKCKILLSIIIPPMILGGGAGIGYLAFLFPNVIGTMLVVFLFLVLWGTLSISIYQSLDD